MENKKGKYVSFTTKVFIPEEEWNELQEDYGKWIIYTDRKAFDRIRGYASMKKINYNALIDLLFKERTA